MTKALNPATDAGPIVETAEPRVNARAAPTKALKPARKAVKPATEPETIVKDDQPRSLFDCNKCPAFCCSIYDRVRVTKRDVNRLAKHFNVPYEVALRRYTKDHDGERVLKRVPDHIFPKTCMFLDQHTRRCTIYTARPAPCREYPNRSRCAYYDLLQFERQQQGQDSIMPVIELTFRKVGRVKVEGADGPEKRWTWGEVE